MPPTTPVFRREIAATGAVTDWRLRHGYLQVAPGVVVPVPEDHQPTAYGGFGIDCVTRAWAQHLRRPDEVLAGWAAAGIYGLRPDWCDSAPVLMLRKGVSRGSTRSAVAARRPLRPVIRPLPAGLETRHPCRRFPGMRLVTPQLAAAQCLWTILTDRHTWWVHDVPGLSRREVRAVQFLDAFFQCTWVTRDDILEASAGLIGRDCLARLLALADDGAQSPMETVMRLMVRDLLPPPFQWESQIRVDLDSGAEQGWTPRTLPDLGNSELRIALYYDGGHHGTASQTEVDFDQYHALRDKDWEVFRFTKESIRVPAVVRDRTATVIARAIARWEASP